MNRLDELLVASERKALSIRECGLKFSSQFVHSHFDPRWYANWRDVKDMGSDPRSIKRPQTISPRSAFPYHEGMPERRLHLPDSPNRILLIRLSAIGDIIMASGLIPALRSRWPDAHLAWLAEEGPHQLLMSNPRLDRVYPLPRRHWKKLSREGRRGQVLSEMMRQRTQLRKESFDLVLDLQGLLKSGIWAFATGARHRIGLGSREGSSWLMTDTFPREEHDPRMGKEYRALAMALGADPRTLSLIHI